MILAAIDWLSLSINLVLFIFVGVCLLMTLLILMQRPKQEGLGAAFGAGVTDQVFGARTTNVLQRGTVYLGSAFFILSLTLAVLIGKQNKQQTLTKKVTETPAAVAPAAPEAPKSLSDELPVAPASPAPAPQEVPADAPVPADAAGEVPATPAPAETAPGAVPTEPAPAPETPADKPQ